MSSAFLQSLDPTINPPHYTRGGIETIDFIEAKGLGFHLGNAVKYISRCGHKTKDPRKDLEKAMWYIERYLETQCEEKQGG